MAVDANGNEIIQKSTEEIARENDNSRSQTRIKELSDKVELTSKDRDEMKSLVGERDKKIVELERENSFNSGFVDILGTHAAAKDHKDEIKAKVLTGYTVEDATFAVLGKAGKLGTVPQTPAPQVAGGSATTNAQSGQKEVKDMTLAEKREILAKDMVWN